MKYGVILSHYKGDLMNMWVYDDKGRFETTDFGEALKVKVDYENRNPGGYYSIQEIEEKKDV